MCGLSPGSFLLHTISTGLALTDEILGGGLPRGSIVELFGLPSSGKTTIALNWVAAAQREGLTAVWVDADRTLDLRWAAQAGVTPDELVLVRPDCGPQAAGIVDRLLRTFSVDLIFVDSAAALSDSESPGSPSENESLPTGNGFLSRMLRRCRMLVERTGAVLVFVNPQYQRDPGDITGFTPGGRVLTQYTTIRIAVRSLALVMNQGACTGHRLAVVAVKNKMADPFQEVLIDLDGARLRAPLRRPAGRETHSTRRASQAG